MKNRTELLSLLLTLLLIFTAGISVYASPAPDTNGQAASEAIISQLPTTDNSDVRDDSPAQPEEDAIETPAEENESETVTASTSPKSSNTPFFIGAVIAVILFIGVAMYCKFNGNKSL